MPDIKADAAVCEICGGSLIFTDDRENFKCENCGLLYPKGWVREKVQKITGTVRIDGTVKVEGIQSADRLAENAETLIKLKKYDEAINLYKKIQADSPNDYRGWWGTVRVRSDDFSNVSLNQKDYESIIGDAKSAIKVSDTITASKLKRMLDRYVTAVFSHTVKNKKVEILSNKDLTEKKLAESRIEQEKKQNIFLKTQDIYNRALNTHSRKETELKASEKSVRTVGTVLNAIAGCWALFILVSVIMEWDSGQWFAAVLGIILMGFLIPFWIANFITGIIASSTKRQKRELAEFLKSMGAKKLEYEKAKEDYDLVCGKVNSLEENKKQYEYILSEISGEVSQRFREEFISGKKEYNM